MTFRTPRKLKNMILSINFAILTFFLNFLSKFLKHFRVGRYENLFIFLFWKAIKIAGSAQKKQVAQRATIAHMSPICQCQILLKKKSGDTDVLDAQGQLTP